MLVIFNSNKEKFDYVKECIIESYSLLNYMYKNLHQKINLYYKNKIVCIFLPKREKSTEFGKHFYLFFVILYLIMGDEFRNDIY